jgi:hypothetical protein
MYVAIVGAACLQAMLGRSAEVEEKISLSTAMIRVTSSHRAGWTTCCKWQPTACICETYHLTGSGGRPRKPVVNMLMLSYLCPSRGAVRAVQRLPLLACVTVREDLIWRCGKSAPDTNSGKPKASHSSASTRSSSCHRQESMSHIGTYLFDDCSQQPERRQVPAIEV